MARRKELCHPLLSAASWPAHGLGQRIVAGGTSVPEVGPSQRSKFSWSTYAMGHSRPSHFVPVLNNVRYASDSDHSRYESELTLWATSGHPG
jgi:hypothetical protein